ncbi:thioesterase family protein [Rudaea sp.]|uniref:acyl-CoA thioesterase n=1 Tax=Rudaea sp. TaxID=2136325 RepID=UPI002ED508D1
MNDATVPALRKVAEIAIALRWGDQDAFGHVNNAMYLRYLEEARVRWLADLVKDWDRGSGSKPIMAAVQANYRRPLTWPGEIVVQLFCEKLGNSSITIAHRIVDARDKSVLYMDGNVVMVWIDPATGRSTPLPEAIRTACA